MIPSITIQIGMLDHEQYVLLVDYLKSSPKYDSISQNTSAFISSVNVRPGNPPTYEKVNVHFQGFIEENVGVYRKHQKTQRDKSLDGLVELIESFE
jgi:hypothetical protein